MNGPPGALVQRRVVLVEGVTEHAHVKEEPRAWAPRARLKSVRFRIVQVRNKVFVTSFCF